MIAGLQKEGYTVHAPQLALLRLADDVQVGVTRDMIGTVLRPLIEIAHSASQLVLWLPACRRCAG